MFIELITPMEVSYVFFPFFLWYFIGLSNWNTSLHCINAFTRLNLLVNVFGFIGPKEYHLCFDDNETIKMIL